MKDGAGAQTYRPFSLRKEWQPIKEDTEIDHTLIIGYIRVNPVVQTTKQSTALLLD